jgi:hypothetical protein
LILNAKLQHWTHRLRAPPKGEIQYFFFAFAGWPASGRKGVGLDVELVSSDAAAL